MAVTYPPPHPSRQPHHPLDLIPFTDMPPDRTHSFKNQVPKPPKPTRYRRRHQSLRDLGEETTQHGFISRVHSPLSPSPGPTYTVIGQGESHSISLTNENFPTAFSYGEKQRQLTPESRTRKHSSSASSSTSSSSSRSRPRAPSSASSATSSSTSSVYSPASNPSSPLPLSQPLNAVAFEGPRDVYIAQQNFSNPHTGFPIDARFMENLTTQQFDLATQFPNVNFLDGDFNPYSESNVDASLPQFPDGSYHNGIEWRKSVRNQPALFVPQQNYPHCAHMNQCAVPITCAPNFSSISSDGQPYVYPLSFTYPPEPRQIHDTMSNNFVHMSNQANVENFLNLEG